MHVRCLRPPTWLLSFDKYLLSRAPEPMDTCTLWPLFVFLRESKQLSLKYESVSRETLFTLKLFRICWNGFTLSENSVLGDKIMLVKGYSMRKVPNIFHWNRIILRLQQDATLVIQRNMEIGLVVIRTYIIWYIIAKQSNTLIMMIMIMMHEFYDPCRETNNCIRSH